MRDEITDHDHHYRNQFSMVGKGALAVVSLSMASWRVVPCASTPGKSLTHATTRSPRNNSTFRKRSEIISECTTQISELRRHHLHTTGSLIGEDDGVGRLPFYRIFYNDIYEVDLPPNHRFPMEKYRKVRLKVQEQVTLQQKRDGRLVNSTFQPSPLISFEDLATTHDPGYIKSFLSGDQSEAEQRNVGFPWSRKGVDRALSSVGGTVAAACAVCEVWRDQQKGDRLAPWSAHVAGGTHHAFYDFGEGFCVFSDMAVAANVILRDFGDVVQRILFVDLDVHQGNGNAVLFSKNDRVFTFSMHCNANYFSPKQQSDLDIELPAGCDDHTYLVTLRHWLRQLLAKQQESDEKYFDLIFFQAGVDILEVDRLGRMNLSENGVRERNELVFDWARQMGVPMVTTMGGGYPSTESNWKIVVDAHASVYFQAYQCLARNRRIAKTK